MATNRKGGNPIVALLLAHGEKLVIAIVAALFGWLAYGSLQYEVVEQKPEELLTLARNARSHYENDFAWSHATSAEDGARLAETFKPLASVEVIPKNYAISSHGWDPGIIEDIRLRTDPPVLTALSLVGSGATELMGFEGDDAFKRGIELKEIQDQREEARRKEREQQEEERRGDGFEVAEDRNRRPIANARRNAGVALDADDYSEEVSYVTLLAKVPVEQQTQAYWSTFENALGFDRSSDQPVYEGYLVQRRDVTAGKQGEWQAVAMRNKFDRSTLSSVNPNNILKSTADWLEKIEEVAGRDYTHEILTIPLPPVLGRMWGPEAVHPDIPLQVEVEIEEQKLDRQEAQLDRQQELEEGGGGFFDNEPDADQQLIEEEEQFDDLQYETPFVMLRYFDMTVEPGRQYQYRVQLVLADPNGFAERGNLDKQVIKRLDLKRNSTRRFRFSEWSEPTAPISVPRAGGVRLASIRPTAPGAANAEPSITLLVKGFDQQAGNLVEATTEREFFRRGATANYIGEAEYIDGRELVRTEQFRFRTDITLLDVSGGNQLARKELTPTEILVMDASGRMSVRTDLTDANEVQATRSLYSEEENRAGGGGGCLLYTSPSPRDS